MLFILEISASEKTSPSKGSLSASITSSHCICGIVFSSSEIISSALATISAIKAISSSKIFSPYGFTTSSSESLFF